jgi:EmrB/QacA subfamily drug resistance transporter
LSETHVFKGRRTLSATSRDTSPAGPLPGEPASLATGAVSQAQPRGVQDAARDGAPRGPKHLGLALAVIATAQLMVVLDATIVNVALPHIQNALHFSGTNLEWVINAYTLAFGGLLLLGGRSGDLLGRRRVFIFGVLLFSLASLAGGFATTQAWLLTARVVQGVGGAFAAPTALALIAVNFPEGRARNRAMGVYAAMSVAGGAVGLIAGGLLTQYVSWRWVLFVNVPIGLAVVFAAPRVLGESERRHGKFDLPGAITGTLGITSLVYGLSNAATSQNGQSHWGDNKVVVSLIASVVLLAAFVFIESRSKHALLPFRVLRNRNRSGAYIIMLCLGTAMFGMFFFLTLFLQEVWGYSALGSGIAYLPFVSMILVASALASQLVARIGAKPLLLVGSVFGAGGLFWLSQVTEHSDYASGLLGAMMVTAFGFGLMFVPLSLLALSKVREEDTGVASSLLNTGQQVGGAIGLAILGTVAWSAFASNLGSATAKAKTAAVAAAHAGHPVSKANAATEATQIFHHALAYGFSHGYYVSAGIAVLALVVTVLMINVKREDLAGINPMQTGA